VTDDEWQAMRVILERARCTGGDPPPPRWGATTSDGTWKTRMAVLMTKHIKRRRRKNWEALKQSWIAANTARRMLG
jgi:hypothetical protein